MLLCLFCHDVQGERLRVGGVPLKHDRQVSESERWWAAIRGLSELFAAWGERYGERGIELGNLFRRGASALGRLLAGTEPGWFGPDPGLAYRLRAQRVRRRRPLSTRMPAPPPEPVFEPEQLAALIGALTGVADALLGDDTRSQEYVETLRRIGASATELSERLEELSAYPRLREWDGFLSSIVDRLVGVIDAVAEVERPGEPTDAELSAVRQASLELRELECLAEDFFLGLAQASDADDAFVVIDGLLDRRAKG
ncbi:MAG: hypothetical protein ACRDLE_02955 [Gaiellaceae bacterium]